MPRALRENGSTTVSIAVFTSTLWLLGRVVTTTVASLEAKVTAAWFITVGLLCPLQGILVGKRRCSGHWLVQYGAMAAYYLPTLITFYAAKAVYSTSHFCEYTPSLEAATASLLCFTLYFSSRLGVVVTHMIAYSLRDGPHDRWLFIQWFVFLGYLEWEWWSRTTPSVNRGLMMMLSGPNFLVALLILFGKPPESTLDFQTKAVAEYMKRESSKSSTSSPFFDEAKSNSSLQLDCCRYPFMQKNDGDGQWVSIKDLLHRYDLPKRHKDIYLSYSLSRLLARRYYRFPCTEEGDERVRRFALADLGRRRTDGYKRAFTIVEVQLAFLYDYFFTTSLQLIELQDIQTYSSKLNDPVVTLGICLLGSMARDEGTAFGQIRSIIISILVSCMLARVSFVLSMPGQFLLPYWTPINMAFHQVNQVKPSIFERFLRVVNCSRPNDEQDVHPTETRTTSVYWSNKIAQYSILHDYDCRRPWRKEFLAWFRRHVLSQPSYSFIRHLPVAEEDVRVPVSVKILVADTLRDIDGLPTNGTRSLKINMASSGYDWSWTCRQETHTHTILIWHIATCYCGMAPPHSYRHNSLRLVEKDTWYEVATTLSRYCAYLVAFLPEFLPEHRLTTKQVFQDVIQDAQCALGLIPMEEKEKHTKFRGLRLPSWRRQMIFHNGVKLGRKLERQLDTRLRWKVMAEFRAEKILYIAPSDNAEAHIEHLAKGGEFVTHLWAMLSNAGILKRATGE